jgi:2-dehydro-3-deoxyphosphogluconate aldolase/(4S)-4-hydroxy-2-oxoglutarate aldolase
MTPSEIIKAEQFGLNFVKLFPGNILGPGFLSAIREVFPSTHFLPTGGVEPEAANLKAWFNAGASAVGMGSKLLNHQLIDMGAFDQLREKTKEVLETIKKVKA